MAQNITYTVKNGLYVNMTNRCTCDCDFCLRKNTDAVGDAESLWLDCEPTREQVWDSIVSRDLAKFSELVFCGFGEPMIRADDLFWIAHRVKQELPSLSIRINTNGHGNMISGSDITFKMAKIIDHLSVSLNRADAKKYSFHVRPIFGEFAFEGMLDFVKKAKIHVPKITLTAIDSLPPDEISDCQKIAKQLGVDFRVRAAY
jgi:TatD family-associated radical SAM protein